MHTCNIQYTVFNELKQYTLFLMNLKQINLPKDNILLLNVGTEF